MSHSKAVHQILNELSSFGVEHLVLCPGGRNSPFIDRLSKGDHPFHLHPHFDERSASFFALGLSQNQKRPVALLTTSGTAVSETLSACIEAHYTRTPLVILSADRPKNFRGTGAPQTIDQKDLLSSHCELQFDLENQNLDLSQWTQAGPLHINVCFDEPLIDPKAIHESLLPPLEHSRPSGSQLFSKESLQSLEEAFEAFSRKVKNPILIVSGDTGFEAEALAQSLSKMSLPLFLECTSSIKSHPALKGREIQFPDMAFKKELIDGVIRLGQVPIHRFWRDLEKSKVPVLNVSAAPFPGMTHSKEVFPPHMGLFEKLKTLSHSKLNEILDLDQLELIKLKNALNDFPLSESALIHQLQLKWNGLTYLGNSLPIREWDLVAALSPHFDRVHASRGANGIDGQISTYIGRAHSHSRSLGVFGDLTSLYD
ncbi:2-succinyl-5-enolpyruvyl-6-hydroxy-3-cyclohexene-1-carboxylic-acid synthase, partial [bacterium]|nr:2-succinyl-5-enolpyruvyl-6-hydroxy-3-cyclohexene-1-carboxylic-acid synthase [bacterium]